MTSLALLSIIFALYYFITAVACVWAVSRGLEEIRVCDQLRSEGVPKEWIPFLRPPSSFLPPSRLKMFLRAFFIAPLGYLAFMLSFSALYIYGAISGSHPLRIYPVIGYPLTVLLGIKIVVKGTPARVPVLVATHTGIFDIHVLASVDQKVAAVAKSEIRSFAFIGAVAKQIGCIFVDRADETNRKIAGDVIREFMEEQRTRKDKTLIVFPEGTTTNHLYIIPFKTGVFAPLVSDTWKWVDGKNGNAVTLATEPRGNEPLTDTPLLIQPVRITYPSPLYSFSVSTHQLVPFALTFALPGGEVLLEYLEPVHREKNETAEEIAERVRDLIAADGRLVKAEGSFRAHTAATLEVRRRCKGCIDHQKTD